MNTVILIMNIIILIMNIIILITNISAFFLEQKVPERHSDAMPL